MRLPILTVAFLFFGVILATPINLARLDNSEIMKRSSHDGRSTSTNTSVVQEYGAGGSISNSPSRITQDIRKRNGWHREQLIEVLGVMSPHPARIEKSGLVYNLHRSLNYNPVAVKIIYLGTGNRGHKARYVKEEATRLHNVQQLLGWGCTEDGEYHYLIMPFLGQPWNHVTPELTKAKAYESMKMAESDYRVKYGVIYKGISLDQCVFMHMPQENKWVAHLVDWSPGTSRAAPNIKKEQSPEPEDPFIIHSGDKVYRPDPKEFEQCQKL